VNVRALFWPVQGGKPFLANVPLTGKVLICGRTWRKVPARVRISNCGCPLHQRDVAQRPGMYRLDEVVGRGEARPMPVYLEVIEAGVN
jgi:hypothetical protein